jgi:predicted DNA-binding protein (UPF0251 family)
MAPRGGPRAPEDIVVGLVGAVAEGTVVQNVPFGWTVEDGKLTPAPKEVLVIRMLFLEAHSGRLSVRKLAKKVGLSRDTTHRILTSAVYWTGDVLHNGKPTYKVKPLVKPPPWSKKAHQPEGFGSTAAGNRGRGRALLSRWLTSVRGSK